MPLPYISFNSTQVTATPYYPDNGVGAFTATVGDALNADYEVTELRRLICPPTNSVHPIYFFHGDGTRAMTFYVEAAATSEALDYKWDEGEGPELRGKWWIQFPAVTAEDYWFVQFQKVR